MLIGKIAEQIGEADWEYPTAYLKRYEADTTSLDI